MIHLDHNATTPIAPEVRDAMLPYPAIDAAAAALTGHG